MSEMIVPPGASVAPTEQQEGALVAWAAQTGRQTRDVPLIAGRRLVPGMAMALGYYRDIRPDEIGLDTYDQIRRDDTVSAALTLLKAPILGRIGAASVQCDDPAVKRVIEYVFLESGLLQRLAKSSFRALDFGVAFHEIEWEATELDVSFTEHDAASGQDTEVAAWQGPGLWPKAFYEVNPQTVREIRRTLGEHAYNGFIQRGWPEVTIEAVNSFVYTPEMEFGNMWGKPKTKDSYPYWQWKQATLKSWMQWVEAKADPSRKAFYPKGTTESGQDNGLVALEAALALSSQTAVALPSESVADHGGGTAGASLRAWDIQEIATTDRTDVFEKTAAYFNSSILKAMFAPERTFSPARETGTFAEAKAHSDTFLLTQDAVQLNWLESVNHFAVARVVDLNFGPAAAVATIMLPGITDEERDFVRDVFMKLLAAADPSLGGVVDIRELAEDQGLPTTDVAAPEVSAPGVYVPPSGGESALPGQQLPQDPSGGVGGLAPQLNAADRTALPLDEEILARIELHAKALARRFRLKEGTGAGAAAD